MFSRKNDFMDWQTYKSNIDFIDLFYFQQKTREESIRNL